MTLFWNKNSSRVYEIENRILVPNQEVRKIVDQYQNQQFKALIHGLKLPFHPRTYWLNQEVVGLNQEIDGWGQQRKQEPGSWNLMKQEQNQAPYSW